MGISNSESVVLTNMFATPISLVYQKAGHIVQRQTKQQRQNFHLMEDERTMNYKAKQASNIVGE